MAYDVKTRKCGKCGETMYYFPSRPMALCIRCMQKRMSGLERDLLSARAARTVAETQKQDRLF